nr:c-4 methylsterol oxidase [Colletotrichum truncatum]KAF6781963.1 c-4 methylsterol oxidase [Colletotrichum truncatum]
MSSWNSTVVFPNGTESHQSYLGVLDDVNKYNVQLNIIERLWAAWYLWMQNDILATGIMTFVMHEVVYFGRSLPWIIIDAIPYFRRWKIQQVSTPS